MESKSKPYNNKDMMKSIINLLDKPKPPRNDILLAWEKTKKLDPDLKGKKAWDNFRSVKGRDEYVTKLMKLATAGSLKRVATIAAKEKKEKEEKEQGKDSTSASGKGKGKGDKEGKGNRKRVRPTYTVNFRILTLVDSEQLKKVSSLFEATGSGSKSKSSRSTTINGMKYKQIGKEYSFETTDKWFFNNFRANGTKKDYIIRATRGEKGSRWNRAVGQVMKTLEEMGAHHIISYMDAIYIPKVSSSASLSETTNVKSQKKHDDSIKGLYHEYLYHDLDEAENKYLDHPYLKENFKEKSCLLTAIIETYSEAFKQKKKDGRRQIKENLTYEYLCNLFGLECGEANIGCTLQEARPFFEKFRLGLKVFDIYNNVVEEYVPPIKNAHISPSTLYLITFNGHVFTLDENLKALQQKVELIGASPIDVNKISQNYRIQDQTDNKEYHVCETWDDIKELIQEEQGREEDEKEKEKETDLRIQYYGVLNQLVYELVFKERYCPKVSIDVQMVTGITLNIKLKKHKFNIRITSIDQGTTIDEHCSNDMVEDIKVNAEAYGTAYATYYKWLVNRRQLSTYDPLTHQMEKETMLTPLCCSFKWTDSPLIALDMNKAYTSNLRNMVKFPSFNAFDKYQDYDQHPIEDYTMYYIRAVRSDSESSILFASRFSRAYGFKLNRIRRELFEIISFKRPSNLTDTNAKQRIQELYEDKTLTNDAKKQIINVLIGLLEKKSNNQSSCKLFLDKGEAQYYVEETGGKVGELSFYEDVDDDVDDGVHRLFATGNQEERTIYTATHRKDRELIDGFLPIKEMVYDIQRLKLYLLYEECKRNGIEVHGIKTDCVLVKSSDQWDVQRVFGKRICNKVGGLKIEHDKRLFGDRLEMIENMEQHFPKTEVVNLEIKDEYDKEELGDINLNNNKILYLAMDAGCGKSTACWQGYAKEEVVFVSPFNAQSIELKKEGFDAVTINKFFGKGIGDMNFGNAYDWSKNKLIVFDEILLNNIHYLNMVRDFVEKHGEEIRIVANGDVNQLKPINFGVNNVRDETKYRMECVQSIFPNNATLKKIKRLKSAKDRNRMRKIKKAIFKGTGVEEICETFGIKTVRDMKDVTTTSNIAYFNFRCNYVNKAVHNKAKKPSENSLVHGVSVWQGLELQCKKHFKNKGGFKTFVNNLYRVEGIGKYIKIVDQADSENVFHMERDMLWKIFSLPYCSTCHSKQGCSIAEEITIFDANTPYVDRYWLYTAITRARELDKVSIFIHSDQSVAKLEESKLKQYISNKIGCYKEQDKVANRPITKDYVDWEWYEKEFEKNQCCHHCQKGFEWKVDKDKNITSDITFDRIDDSQCHSKGNLVLSCWHCNCCKIKY